MGFDTQIHVIVAVTTEAGILIAGLHSYTLRLHDYRSEALMKPTRSKPFLRPYQTAFVHPSS